MNKRTLGTYFEEQAAAYLQSKGMKILARNFRCRTGEIDLIAMDDSYLVFVEVKYRTTNICGAPEAAVSQKKQITIRRVAEYYMLRFGWSQDRLYRFDVVAVYGSGEIVHYPNAFGGL